MKTMITKATTTKTIIGKASALILAGTMALGGQSVLAAERTATAPYAASVLTSTSSVIENIEVWYNAQQVTFDVQPIQLDGILMLPLRSTLEALGYTIIWNGEEQSIDIYKGAQFTTVYIGKNSYFFNKVAPAPLSREPMIIEGRTMVPAEFFIEILKLGMDFDGQVLKLVEESYMTTTVCIQKVERVDGGYVLTITEDLTDGAVMSDETPYAILTVSDAFSINQHGTFNVGDQVVFTHLPYMTMIYPPQYQAITIR